MSALARMMFSVARSQPAGMLVRNCFAHWSFLLPLKRIQESPEYVAFYHPKPAYEHHMLIVPKKQIPNLFVLGKYPRYAAALLAAAQDIVADLHWKAGNYILCANGGPRQDIPQVHFHLYAAPSPLLPSEGAKTEMVQQYDAVKVVCCTGSKQSVQLQLIALPQSGSAAPSEFAPSNAFVFSTLLQALPTLDQQYHLMQEGYTFVVNDVEALNLTGYVLTRSKGEA